jgi:hypothetical protein
LIVGGAAAYYAHAANRYADEANGFAAASNERLEWEQSHQYANKVYLGEAPGSFYKEFGREDPNEITWVVLNASGIEIHDVWIEGEDNRWIEIEGVQRCTAYSAPLFTKPDHARFRPVAVHFSDPMSVEEGYVWRRTTTGELTTDGVSLVTKREGDPDGEDDGDTVDYGDVNYCAG